MRNALLVCALGTGGGCLLVVAGFALAPGFNTFAVALAAGEFAMFMTQVRGWVLANLCALPSLHSGFLVVGCSCRWLLLRGCLCLRCQAGLMLH